MLAVIEKFDPTPVQAKILGVLLASFMFLLVILIALTDLGHIDPLGMGGGKMSAIGRGRSPQNHDNKTIHLLWFKRLEFKLKPYEDFCVWELLHTDNHISMYGNVLEHGVEVGMRITRPNYEQVVEESASEFDMQAEVHQHGDHAFCVSNKNENPVDFTMSVFITEKDGMERFARLANQLADFSQNLINSIFMLQADILIMEQAMEHFFATSQIHMHIANDTARLVNKWSIIFSIVLLSCAGAQVLAIRRMFRNVQGPFV